MKKTGEMRLNQKSNLQEKSKIDGLGYQMKIGIKN